MTIKLTAALAALLAAVGFNASGASISSPGDPALAGATVVDFNAEALGTFNSRSFGGVTINGSSLTISNDSNAQYAPPSDPFLDNRNSGGSFEFIFGSAVSAFGMAIGAANSPWSLTAYDALNNIIETLAIPAQVNVLPFPWSGFYGISAGSPSISRVVLLSNDWDWLVVDDVTFGQTTQVPEPGTLALLGLGLAGIALSRRRRQ